MEVQNLGEFDARLWLHELDRIHFDAVKMGLEEPLVMTDEEVREEIDRLYPGGIAAFNSDEDDED
jgi:hypothetical protein